MTDPSDAAAPPDDEIVSAHLDDEATSGESARVESDPMLVARLHQFDEVSSRVRDVPEPPSGVVEDHLGSAMAAFDAVGAEPSGDAGAVIDRRDRHFWHRVPSRAVAAAAAVLLVAVGAIGIATSTGEETGDTASRDLPDDAGTAGGTSTGRVEADGGAAFQTTETAPLVNRGRFADTDELADHLRAQLSSQPTATAGAGTAADDDAGDDTAGDRTTGEGTDPAAAPEGDAHDADAASPSTRDPRADPCDAVQLLGLDPASVIAVVPAFVGERPVTAVVHRPEDGRRLVVVDDESCAVADERAL